MATRPFAKLVGAVQHSALTRRGIAQQFGATALATVLALTAAADVDARRRGKKRRNTKPKTNRFGCRNVGVTCSSASQCCSGICKGRGGKNKNGKKRKKTCRAHDMGGCRADLESCSANRDITCTTTTGEDGFCHLTTGNAPYCAFDGRDSECTRDEDCVELCGPLAACSVCAVPGEEEFRFCAGPGSCTGPQPE